MHPGLVVVVVAAGVTAPAFARPGQTGKIVRVERPGQGAGVLRFCDVRAEKHESQCFGPSPPVRGDIVSVVDETHKVIDLKITSVSPMRDGCNVAWTVTYAESVPADVQSGIISGVIGGGIGPRGHRVTGYDRKKIPEGFPEEQIIFAIDRDGNEQPEIAISLFMCDASGQPGNGSGDEFCINLWHVDDKDRFTRASALTNVRQCLGRN